MSENDESNKPQIETVSSKVGQLRKTPKSEREDDDVAPPLGKGWIFAILCIFLGIMIIATVTLGVMGQRSFQDIRASKKEIAAIQAKVETSDSEVTEKQKLTTEQLATLKQKFQVLENDVTTLQHNSKDRNRNWVLQEVEYLINLAQYNAKYEQNVPIIVNLLKQADGQLADLNDPSLTGVREKLTNALVAYKAIPKEDLQGTLLKLASLSKQIPDLPTKFELAAKPAIKIAAIEKSSESDANVPGWKKHLQTALEKLQQIVVIRHHVEPAQQIPASISRSVVDQHLEMLLTQLQWAVMHQNQKVFQDALHQAISWVEKNYSINAEQTKAFINILTEMQAINLQPKLPDLENLQIQLKQALLHNPYAKSRYAVNNTAQATSNTEAH